MENKTHPDFNWRMFAVGLGAGILFYLVESLGQVVFLPSDNLTRQFFWPDFPSFLFRTFGAVIFAVLAAGAHLLISRRKPTQENILPSQLELQAARENEIRYRSYFENTKDVLFQAGRDFQILEISPSVETILGYQPQEIIGRSLAELSLIDPDYLEKAFLDAKRGLAGETIRDSEYRLIAKDGTGRYASISSVPLYRGPEIVGSISIARDITERKRIEAELARSEGRYKSLVEEAEAGIAQIDVEGNFKYVNRAMCKLTGYREEELIGKNFREFLHPADREQISQIFARSMASPPEPYLDEYRILHQSGREIYISTKPTFIHENDQLTGAIVIAEDVTERRKAQDLIYAQRDLGVALSAADSLPRALELCVEAAQKVSGMDSGGVYLVEEQTGALELAISRGLSPDFVQAASHYDASAPNTILIMKGETVFSCYSDLGLSLQEVYRREGLRAMAVIPILFENKVIACLNMASHVSDDIPMMARHALASISTQIGNVIARIKAEEALRESEEMYKTLTETSSDAVLVADLSGTILRISPRSAEILRARRAKDIIGKNWIDLVSPGDQDEYQRNLAQALARGFARNEEYNFVRMDASRFPGEMNVAVIKDRAGNPKVIIITIRDISERKQAEKAVRYQASLLANVSDAVISTDLDFKILSWNNAAEKVYGWKESEVLGRRFYQINRTEYPFDKEGEVIKKFFQNGFWRGEVIERSKDGRVINALSSVSMINDRDGKPVGAVAVHHDITERKMAVEIIRQSRERYKKLLDTYPDIVIVTNLEGKIIEVSDKFHEYYGWDKSFLDLPVSVFELLPPGQEEKARGKLQEIFQDGMTKNVEFVLPKQDGSTFIGEINSALINDSSGKPKEIIHTIRDITERRRAEKAMQYQARLLANVSDAVISTSLDFTILTWNKAAEDVYGWEEGEVIGQPLYLLTKPEFASVRGIEVIKKLFRDGFWRGETIEQNKDGRRINIMSSVSLIRNSGWEPVGVVTVNRDITERKRGEEAVRESEEMYRTLIETTSDAVVITDLSGTILQISPRSVEMFKARSPEEIIGRKAIEFIAPEDHEKARGDLAAIQAQGYYRNAEYALIRMDNSRFPAEANAALINLSGNQKALILTIRDITERKKAEEAIIESRERFKILLDTSHDMVVVTDLSGRITDISEQFLEHYGVKNPVQEVIGQGINLLSPDQLDKAAENFKILYRDGILRNVEYVFPTLDGKVYIAEVNSALIKDSSGQPQAVISSVRDITQRKQAEEALRESEEMYRTLAETTSDAVTVIDLKGKPLRASERARELFLGDKPYKGINQSGLQYIDPEYHKTAGQMMQKIFSEGFVRNVEMILVRADQTRFYGEVNAALIRNEAGEPRAVISTVRDISERKRIEAAIQRAAGEWLTTFDTMPDMVMLIDKKYRILRVNRAMAQTLKLPFQEIVGKTCCQLLHGSQTPPEFCPHAKTLAEGKEHTEKIHEPFLNRDYIVTDTPIRDESGQVVRTVHVMRDITEEEKMQEELRRFEKMAAIGEIAGGIAHEIKNPLFAISTSIQVLQDSPGLAKEKKKILDILFEETMRVNRLIKQLLEFGARTRLDRSKQNVWNLINGVISLNRGLFKSKGIRVFKKIPPGLPPLWVDKDKITQVLINLLHNAVEASKRGDRISILCEAEPTKNNLTIKIRDQGSGIPEEIREKIFAPFFSTKRGNTGMGLAISRKIIAEHRGILRWEPSPAGGGTTFVIELPSGSETQQKSGSDS